MHFLVLHEVSKISFDIIEKSMKYLQHIYEYMYILSPNELGKAR